jgi:predicted DCC family thiol-disulfide oxidoreductase YuxK
VAPAGIVLFDGDCGFCDASIRFLAARDRASSLRFAPLQGATAAGLRAAHPDIPTDLSTVAYVEGDRLYLRSHAFLRLARHLTWPWRWAFHLRWLPAGLLDPAYRAIARRRHRLAAPIDACPAPTPAMRARLLP